MARCLDGVRQVDAVFCRQALAGGLAVDVRDEALRPYRGLSVVQGLGAVERRDGQLGRD